MKTVIRGDAAEGVLNFSVKFSEKECSGCIENKQVLPVTPHVRGSSSSRSQSTEKKRGKISEDLISLETPEKHNYFLFLNFYLASTFIIACHYIFILVPARVRRSQNKRASSSLI